MINEKERKKYIKLASDLLYSKDVIDKIKKAKSEIEIEQILKSARERM